MRKEYIANQALVVTCIVLRAAVSVGPRAVPGIALRAANKVNQEMKNRRREEKSKEKVCTAYLERRLTHTRICKKKENSRKE